LDADEEQSGVEFGRRSRMDAGARRGSSRMDETSRAAGCVAGTTHAIGGTDRAAERADCPGLVS
jgi:hypothetical protein